MKKGWLWALVAVLLAYGGFLTYLFFGDNSDRIIVEKYYFQNNTVVEKQAFGDGLRVSFSNFQSGSTNFKNSVETLGCQLFSGMVSCEFGNNSIPLKTEGSSMDSFILNGDFVLCEAFKNSDSLAEGKIYNFKGADGNTLMHRCVFSPDFGQSCVFKGDSNMLKDGLVNRESVLAKCNWMVRYVG